MFLAVHASVGALAGNAVASPVAAFVLGFVSHFFIDMIPHGDAAMYEGYKSGAKRRIAIFYVAADAVATLVIIATFFLFQDFFSPLNVALGIVGGLLPDLIVGLYEMVEPRRHKSWYRRLESFHVLHMKNHCYLGKFFCKDQKHGHEHVTPQEFLYDLKFSMKQFTERDIPFKYGLLLQGVTLVSCLIIIL